MDKLEEDSFLLFLAFDIMRGILSFTSNLRVDALFEYRLG